MKAETCGFSVQRRAPFPFSVTRMTGASPFETDLFQQMLARWNRRRLQPQLPAADWEMRLAEDMRMLRREQGFLSALRQQVAAQAAQAPSDAEGFVAWFEALEQDGPGQGDLLFPWLAEEAPPEALRWFFTQEAAGEAGFDDLVAMTQVKLPRQAKLELARNYWDEMGHGTEQGMHGPMLDDLARTLDVRPEIETTVWESLALANAMTAMATSRTHAWHAVGALGVIELTAPGRSEQVARGLARIGLSGRERRYFTLHAVLDRKHSEAWIREAIRPLVAEDPTRASAIAEGALMRLHCGARCFARYRSELWGDAIRP